MGETQACDPKDSVDDKYDNKDDIEYSDISNATTGEEESSDMQSRTFKVYIRIGEPYLRIK